MNSGSTDTSDSSSDDHYLADGPEELQEVLEGTAPGKAPATTEKGKLHHQRLRSEPITNALFSRCVPRGS